MTLLKKLTDTIKLELKNVIKPLAYHIFEIVIAIREYAIIITQRDNNIVS